MSFKNKKKVVKMRLVYKPSVTDEHGATIENDTRVFQVIDDPKLENNRGYIKNREKLLQGFNVKEIEKFEDTNLPKKQLNRLMLAPELQQKITQQASTEKQALWQKVKEYEESKKKNKKTNNDEINDANYDSWEDEDGEEYEEIDDENYEIEEHEEYEEEEEETKEPLTLKDMMMNNQPVNMKNLQISKDIKMKLYDENGLLIDGYNYYQHIAKDDSEGQVTAVLRANYARAPQLKPDIDYEEQEMTNEQREVFMALQEPDIGWEELEDDFVNLVNDGKEVLTLKDTTKKKEQEDDLIQNALNKEWNFKKEDNVNKMSNQEFLSIMDEHIMEMKQNDRKNDEKPEESQEQVDEVYVNHKELRKINKEKKQLQPKKLQRNKKKKFYGKYIDADDYDSDKNDYPSDESYHSGEDYEDNSSNASSIDQIDWDDVKSKPKLKTINGEVFELQKKQYIPPIDPKEDHVLKEAMRKENEDICQNQISDIDSSFYRVKEIDTETIETRTQASSFMTKKLNMIEEEKKPKKVKDVVETIDEQEESINISKIVEDVFVKRQKGETAEEKKARKQVIKEFKKENREKKQKFKNEFQDLKNKKQQAEKGNLAKPGMSVFKL